MSFARKTTFANVEDELAMTSATDDSFVLHDLKVEVVGPAGAKFYCGARHGDYFELKGEMLFLPPGQGFSIYSLGALLPLLAAKQRPTHPNDWRNLATDAEVTCPTRTAPRVSRSPERARENSRMRRRRRCR